MLAISLGLALVPGVVLADGTLPPLPYRYLHPPAALAGNNKPPSGGARVLPVDYMRASSFGAFSQDTQVGVTGPRGTFAVKQAATAVELHMTPADTPSGLPAQVAPDSNAYRITATEQPDGSAVRLAKAVNVVLRWPHIPIAMYRYQNGSWHQVCSSDTGVLTSSILSCPTKKLGLFVAVTIPSATVANAPTTPASGLNPYIPILSAAILIIIAIVLGYIVTHPGKQPPPRKQKQRRRR
jgi:hypothetical protein